MAVVVSFERIICRITLHYILSIFTCLLLPFCSVDIVGFLCYVAFCQLLAGASMSSTSRGRCHCSAAKSVDGVPCVAFGDVADSVVMPTDESCYDEVVEATGSDVCEFGVSPAKPCQKQGKCAGPWRYFTCFFEILPCCLVLPCFVFIPYLVIS